MSRFVLNFCVRCDFESFACVPGFCSVLLRRGCEIRNKTKKSQRKKLLSLAAELAVYKANVETLGRVQGEK